MCVAGSGFLKEMLNEKLFGKTELAAGQLAHWGRRFSTIDQTSFQALIHPALGIKNVCCIDHCCFFVKNLRVEVDTKDSQITRIVNGTIFFHCFKIYKNLNSWSFLCMYTFVVEKSKVSNPNYFCKRTIQGFVFTIPLFFSLEILSMLFFF